MIPLLLEVLTSCTQEMADSSHTESYIVSGTIVAVVLIGCITAIIIWRTNLHYEHLGKMRNR